MGSTFKEVAEGNAMGQACVSLSSYLPLNMKRGATSMPVHSTAVDNIVISVCIYVYEWQRYHQLVFVNIYQAGYIVYI